MGSHREASLVHMPSLHQQACLKSIYPRKIQIEISTYQIHVAELIEPECIYPCCDRWEVVEWPALFTCLHCTGKLAQDPFVHESF